MNYLKKTIIVLFTFSINIQAQQQYLDSTFGANQNGIVTLLVGNETSGEAVRMQTDQKIIVGGYAVISGTARLLVARYLSNGTLDSTFGTNGITTTTVGTNSYGLSLHLQSDQKIILTGTALNSDQLAVIARYNTDGTLDATYGTGGFTTTMVGTAANAKASALQTDQMSVVTGPAIINGQPEMFAARYTTAGILDSSFGSSGIATISFGDFSVAYALSIQPSDQKIIIAGTISHPLTNEFALARLNTNGTLDNTFGSSGLVTTQVPTSMNDVIYGIGLQSSGKIIVAGSSIITGPTIISLARYNTNGSLDATFGSSGFVLTELAFNEQIHALSIQSDDKIVVVGYVEDKFVAGRYTVDGALDTTFGVNGYVITDFQNNAEHNDVTIQNDGKIVATGFVDNDLLLVRYYANNSDFVAINSPADGSIVTSMPLQVSGNASQTNCTVRLKIDGALVADVLTDENGNYSTTVSSVSNGAHTITADLMCITSPATILASASNNFTVAV